MRKRSKVALAALGLLLPVLIYLGAPSPIDVDTIEIGPFAPLPPSSVFVRIERLITARERRPKFMLYRGGSPFSLAPLAHQGLLLKHPRGMILVDGGLGSSAQQDFAQMPLWGRALLKIDGIQPVRAQLQARGIPVTSLHALLLTHLHWDHASAVEDFPELKIWTTQAELSHAGSEAAKPPSFIRSQYDAPSIQWTLLDDRFSGGRVAFYDGHYDVFGDGAILIVRMPGHTPGSLGVFVNTHEGPCFLVGDTVWNDGAIAARAEKMPVGRWMADRDPAQVRAQIARLVKLKEKLPRLKIMPSHQ